MPKSFCYLFCYSLIILPNHMEMFLKIAKLSQDQKQVTGVMQWLSHVSNNGQLTNSWHGTDISFVVLKLTSYIIPFTQ